jgi:hypothetical protein
MRAAQRGDISIAVRWRNLMAAIHAIINDERTAGDPSH